MKNKTILEQLGEIEAMELALTKLNAKRALSETEKALSITTLGNCQLLMDEVSPTSIYYNRVKGFGSQDLDKLESIMAHYSTKRIKPSFDLTPKGLNDQVCGALMNLGYVAAEQLVFMARNAYPIEADDADLKVEQVTSADAQDYVRLIIASNGGMDISQGVIKGKAEFFCRQDFINYRVYCDGEVAGLGSLFISGNKGYIANDFTFEAFRGRGCQKALLKHRINHAAQLGLETIYTDVEFGSASHENMVRMGFETVFLNTFFIQNL